MIKPTLDLEKLMELYYAVEKFLKFESMFSTDFYKRLLEVEKAFKAVTKEKRPIPHEWGTSGNVIDKELDYSHGFCSKCFHILPNCTCGK